MSADPLAFRVDQKTGALDHPMACSGCKRELKNIRDVAAIIHDMQDEALVGSRFAQQTRDMRSRAYCPDCAGNAPPAERTFKYVGHLGCERACCNPFAGRAQL